MHSPELVECTFAVTAFAADYLVTPALWVEGLQNSSGIILGYGAWKTERQQDTFDGGHLGRKCRGVKNKRKMKK